MNCYKKHLYFIFSVLLLSLSAFDLSARNQTDGNIDVTLLTKEDAQNKSGRNLKFSVLGGPGYSPDYGFLVGGSALMTFDMPGMEGSLRRSVMPVAFSLTFDDGVAASVVMRPEFYFFHDRIRFKGEFSYSNLNSNYYGVGYYANKNIERSDSNTSYYLTQIKINPTLTFRLAKSNWFIGPTYNFQYDKMKDVAEGIQQNSDYIADGGDAEGLITVDSGLGVTVSYDTRDIPSNAYSGMYLDFRMMNYDRFYGGQDDFSYFQIQYRYYMQLSKHKTGRTLAIKLSSENVFGVVPITHLPTLVLRLI